jgi:hypothetical protein
MIEKIGHYAIILRNSYCKDGITFLTPPEYSQQLGVMCYQGGHEIKAHTHNEVKREVTRTQEVLFIRSGMVQANIYDEDRKIVAVRILHAGDVILLAAGGHGFMCMKDSEIVEVKQGPYCGDEDKTRYES